MNKPSITVWIDPKTQVFKVDFNPQELAPAQYGIVIASLIVHIARLYVGNNPETPEAQVVAEIKRGMMISFENIDDMVLPAKAH